MTVSSKSHQGKEKEKGTNEKGGGKIKRNDR